MQRLSIGEKPKRPTRQGLKARKGAGSHLASQRRSLAGMGAVAAVMALANAARATTISIPSTPADLNLPSTYNVHGAGNLGADGYDFFDYNHNIYSSSSTTTDEDVSLPTYVASENQNEDSNAETYSNTYSQIEINNSASSYTGSLQDIGTNKTVDLLRYTLASSDIPYEIQLAILGDNTAANSNDSTYTVSDLTAGVSITTSNLGSATKQNDFYFVDIYNASPNDVIDITANVVDTNPGSGHASLGGVTFDSSSTPEPASAMAMAVGSFGLMRRRRRHG